MKPCVLMLLSGCIMHAGLCSTYDRKSGEVFKTNKFTSFCEKSRIPRRNWRNAASKLSVSLCHVPLGRKSLVHFQICKSLRALCVSEQRNFERKACEWNMLACSNDIISCKYPINKNIFSPPWTKIFDLPSVRIDRFPCNFGQLVDDLS